MSTNNSINSTLATNNTVIGRNAGSSAISAGTSIDHVIVGQGAAAALTSSALKNTIIGNNAASSMTNSLQCVIVGHSAGTSMTGNNNVAIGAFSMGTGATSSSGNTGVGVSSLRNVTSGGSNIGIGNSAGIGINTGSFNVCLGASTGVGITSGNDNTLMGNNCGSTITTGTTNIIVGSGSDVNSATATNRIGIGYATIVSTDNQVMLGNTSTTTLVSGSSGLCALGTTTNPFTNLVLYSSGSVTIAPASQGGSRTYTVPDAGQDSSFVLNKTNEVTGTSDTIIQGTTFIANNASLVTLTMPTTASVGDMFRIIGKGAGGWKIQQVTSNVINFGSTATTTGVGGSLSSTNRYDSISLICITANTTWVVVSSVGNITIV